MKKSGRGLDKNDKDDTQRKKTTLAWSCDMDGPPVHTTVSTVLGGFEIQERIRSAKDKLERQSQERLGLERGRESGHLQTRASECDTARLQ